MVGATPTATARKLLIESNSVDNLSILQDPTVPGLPLARTATIRVADQLGGGGVLFNPVLNKGTNFTKQEREEKHLQGLVPPVYESLELQAERVMYQLRNVSHTPLQKYNALAALAATDQALYYKVLMDNLVELAPIVYTPTVGEVCQKFACIYRLPLGMYFSAFQHRGRFDQLLSNWMSHTVQIIVVTDGGRILGLGDLGTNGLGISIGKVALYVAGAGFHPEHSLPVVLDLGTNNAQLLEDKFYLGEKVPRLEGEEHLTVVTEFCMAVKARWPNCLVQFEDFRTEQAFKILDNLRDKLLCFNDDIQGTGAVVCSGFINGLKAQRITAREARVVFYGAGSSAVGVAHMIASYMSTVCGLTKEEAYQRIYMVDTKGLITTSRGDKLAEHKVGMARTDDTPNMKSLVDIIRHVKPTALIGLAGSGPAFFQAEVQELCAHCDLPLIFPLSNPTSQAEITAADAYSWSQGKCLFASGSPFDPVEYDGRTFYPGQANNVFVFPGIGFGAVMAKAKCVADEMLLAASQACADAVTSEQIAAGSIYPNLNDLRSVSAQVAAAVAEKAFELGIAGLEERPTDMLQYIKGRMYVPT